METNLLFGKVLCISVFLPFHSDFVTVYTGPLKEMDAHFIVPNVSCCHSHINYDISIIHTQTAYGLHRSCCLIQVINQLNS